MGDLQLIDFIVIGLAVLLCGLILFSKKVVTIISAFMGVLTLVALIFLMANAGFLFITQLLIYIGAVSVLLVFSVMLSKRMSKDKNLESGNHNLLGGILIGGSFIGFSVLALNKKFQAFEPNKVNDVKAIGMETMTSYLFTFELLAVFLLIALILSAVIAGKKQEI